MTEKTVPMESAPIGSGDGPGGRPRPSHAARAAAHPVRMMAVAGGVAALAAASIGTVALFRSPSPGASGVTAARKITVTSIAVALPLSTPEILGLLDRPPDFGPLTEPARRASCLAGLGYPASTPVLGARPVRMAGQAAVLLILADDTPGRLAVVVVPGACSTADTGLLAATTMPRP